jgi:predicted nucleic acid-binding protein
MNVLIDTNVALNILLKQPPFYAGSSMIFYIAEEERFIGYISATAITDIFYIAQKKLGKTITKEAIKKLLHVFRPAAVTDKHIYEALDMEWSDFEDSVQYIVGESLSVDYIVTRNIQDFTSGSIPAVTPEQFMQTIADIEK